MEKILFVTNDFGPRAGGIETLLIGFIEHLPKNRVVVYTSSQGDTSDYDAQWMKNFGVRVVRDKAKILLPTPRVARAVAHLAQSCGATVACFGTAAPLGILAKTLRKAGVKRIVALTMGHEVWWVKVPPFSWAIRYIGNSVDALTYLADFTRVAISQGLSKQAADAMVKIAPGIDTAHFNTDVDSKKLRAELSLTDKAVIVSVGRLVHRKGQDKLVAALPQILAAIPNAHLLLVGQGPHREQLESIAAKCGVTDSITFAGRVPYERLPEYIRVGDIFAMPSRDRLFGLEVEGLGIVYLEASACGLPVVVGNSGGAPDALVPNITGILVDGTNIDEIAQACIALLADLDRAAAMGAAGKQWIHDAWSWSYWSGEFERVLQI